MSIFKEINDSIDRAEHLAENLAMEVDEIMEMEGPGIRLGLGPQRNTNKQPARKGDIILRVEMNGALTPFVVSNVNGEKPIAKNTKRGEEIAIIPELLVVGAMTNNPHFKAAAGRMATKYPDRKVFLYGDTKMKKESGVSPDREQNPLMR